MNILAEKVQSFNHLLSKTPIRLYWPESLAECDIETPVAWRTWLCDRLSSVLHSWERARLKADDSLRLDVWVLLAADFQKVERLTIQTRGGRRWRKYTVALADIWERGIVVGDESGAPEWVFFGGDLAEEVK